MLGHGPGFALSVRDRKPDGSAVSSAARTLQHVKSAIEHVVELTNGPTYRVVMPSAKLLLDAPTEAAALVAAAHAASVSVLTWTVRHPFLPPYLHTVSLRLILCTAAGR